MHIHQKEKKEFNRRKFLPINRKREGASHMIVDVFPAMVAVAHFPGRIVSFEGFEHPFMYTKEERECLRT
jgi:hypothetical protein